VSGVVAVLHWLSFVPAVAGNDPATVLTADSVERDIAYVPEKGADPRLMLTGKTLPATTESPKVRLHAALPVPLCVSECT
jgi:hypothetical protein